jgi:hypothetical protein
MESSSPQSLGARFDRLAENPAPTVLAVCARLGVSSSRIYFLHRDLAHAIAARCLREQVESMDRRPELLRNEVLAMVKKHA